MKTKRSILFTTTFIAALLFSLNVSAFGGGGNKRHGGSKPKKPKTKHNKKQDSVPLDGGLSILVLGAAAFGVKKLRDNK